MASLTETSIIARKILRYGVYLLIIGLIARTVFNFSKAIYLKIFPPKPPGANFAFGNKLPKLPFPEKTFPDNLSINVETAEGKLPEFPNILTVYEMPSIPQNITALDDAKKKAEGMGFDPNGRPILESTPNVYIFQKRNIPSTLTMNIVTGIFSISYDTGQDPTVLNTIPLTPELAGDQVLAFLREAQVMTPDLEKGRITHQFIRADGREFIPEVSLSEANLIKVNVFRKNFGAKDDIISVTPELPEANVWFLMGASTRQLVAAEFHHYPININKTGTYPIKTAETALEDLKNKNAFLVSQGDNPDGDITIRKIYLAYYDAGQYAQYYQPVVVFEGDDGFNAYVPAVQSEYYGADPSKAD